MDRQDAKILNIGNDWKLLADHKTIKKHIQKCAEYINANFVGKDVVLTAVLKGAIYFFTRLSQKLVIPHSVYTIEVSSYSDSQKQDNVKINSNIVPEKFANKTVIIVDELYDNGHTMETVKQHICQTCKLPDSNILTCTLFKKIKGNSFLEDCKNGGPDLYGMLVPDVWLVGYGLDHKQYLRNWTSLYACPKSEDIKKSIDDELFTNDDLYNKILAKINS